MLASAVLVMGGASSPAAAAPIDQCNGEFNGGGQGANCQVTVENFLNLSTGSERSTVTTLTCNGAYGTVTTCPGEPVIVDYAFLTDEVNQCNGSVNGGGGSLHCRVVMINTIVGTGTPGAPSVNQCNGSFDSLPLPEDSGCDPVQATSDATITQCNNSMNGGTQVSMNCTVGVSSVAAAMPVSVDQCNNSVEGGGSLLECSTMITTVFVPTDNDDDEGGGSGTGGSGGAGGETAGEGDALSGGELAATGASTALPIGVGAAVILVLGAAIALGRRTTAAH